MIKISKIVLLALGMTVLNGGEIQTGKGTFEMTAGFVGLNKTIQTDIQTYSMVEQHAPLFGSESWFYKYNLTWYDSEQMVAAQNTINTTASRYFPNPPATMTTPSIDYRLQGLDLNLGLGKDLFHKNENEYLGIAFMTGLSTPWIDSKKDSNNNNNLSHDSMDMMKDSKTKIYTYKAGLGLTGRVALNDYFSLYGAGTYAYQNGTFKNDYAKANLKVNGIFQEYDFGIRFQPVSYDKKIGWFTLSPRLYATLGHRYTDWKLKDINIDVTGLGVNFAKTDFAMNSSISYFGLGYSF
jgi:hypothetical protein